MVAHPQHTQTHTETTNNKNNFLHHLTIWKDKLDQILQYHCCLFSAFCMHVFTFLYSFLVEEL